MAAKLCVYIRDTSHPADLYDSTSHHFAVSIHEIGSNTPLIWKGVNYNWIWLPINGQLNRIAGEFEIPAGTYLVKGYAWCQNVVTNLAWVQVADGETATVNLVPTRVQYCLYTAQLGVIMGTTLLDGKEVEIRQIAPEKVNAFEKAAADLAAALPKDMGLPILDKDNLRKLLSEKVK